VRPQVAAREPITDVRITASTVACPDGNAAPVVAIRPSADLVQLDHAVEVDGLTPAEAASTGGTG
jgi:hypothetical protein